MPEGVEPPKKHNFVRRTVKSAKLAFSTSSNPRRFPRLTPETRVSSPKSKNILLTHPFLPTHSKEENSLSETTLGSNVTERTKKRIRLEAAYNKFKSANKSTSSPLLTKQNLQAMNHQQPHKPKKEVDSSSETTLGSKLSEKTKERICRELGVVSSKNKGVHGSITKGLVSQSSQSTLSEESYVIPMNSYSERF